jgi:outer membrane protein OmpA-like peptidoglycan-associated protein
MRKTILSLLLLSATVAITPASANYFSNPRANVNLNIGSAPNPAPRRLPIVVEEQTVTYVQTTEAAPPPPPAASAPPLVVSEAPRAPGPPPVVKRYIVFFDFDKSNLSMEAQQVIATAVTSIKNTGMARIVVTGHTDTVGSQSYNQALSERRASAVKGEMTRLGLNANDIGTVGKSFSEPLIATGPGVREPQNRRAVIDLGFQVTANLGSSD